MLQAKVTKIFVDNKLTLALVNNLVFHEASTWIPSIILFEDVLLETKFHLSL